MKRHSSATARTRRFKTVSLKSRKRAAQPSHLKSSGVQLDPIAPALDRWLTLCAAGQRIPQRVWNELDAACGEPLAHQVHGNNPKAEMIRAWLGYRAAQVAVHRGQRLNTDVSFHAAYLAWMNWKKRGRHVQA